MGSFRTLLRFANAYGTGLIAYLAVAFISAATEWGTFAAAATAMPPIQAALVGFVIATGVNFVLSRRFVFRSRSSWASELALLYLSSAAVFVGNLTVFYVLYDIFDVHLMIAKILGTMAGFVFNFVARQFWIFSPRPRYAPMSEVLRADALSTVRDDQGLVR
jgi:putative flippase GtrA